MKLLTLSIVIPTYNSAIYIDKSIECVMYHLKKKNLFFEVIVIDDFSSDNTSEVIQQQQQVYSELKHIQLKKNYGQRIATSIGYKYSKGDYIVTFDDDLQFKAEDISLLLVEIQKQRKLIVSGYYSYKEKQSYYNVLKTLILNSLNYIFFPRYKHTKFFTPFKIYDRKKMDVAKINNIYFFWKIKNRLIGTLKVEKGKSVRAKRSYNFKQFYRLLKPLIYKILLKTFLFAGLVLSIVLIIFKSLKLIYLMLFILFACLMLIFFLKKEEHLHSKISVKIN